LNGSIFIFTQYELLENRVTRDLFLIDLPGYPLQDIVEEIGAIDLS